MILIVLSSEHFFVYKVEKTERLFSPSLISFAREKSTTALLSTLLPVHASLAKEQ